MEELEQLMARLEDVFQSFRYRRILTFLSSEYHQNKLSIVMHVQLSEKYLT